MQVLLARVGKERLYSEAVDSHIGGWFRNAAVRNRIRPIEQPEYDYVLPESGDEDFRFTATVAVQPKPDVPDWKALEVPRAEPEVPEEMVEQELEVLRDRPRRWCRPGPAGAGGRHDRCRPRTGGPERARLRGRARLPAA